MANVRVHLLVLGASLGLGAADLVWLNFGLAPDVLASPDETPTSVLEVAPISVPTPQPMIEPSPPPPPEPALPAPMRETIFFGSSSTALDDHARQQIDAIAARAPVPATFLLEGHTDRTGEDELNLELGQDRGEAVRDYLVERGVERSRIRVVSRGEQQAGVGEELWRDRRVEIHISGGSK